MDLLFAGMCIGAALMLMLFALVVAVRAYLRGSSRDSLPDGVEQSTTSPDLTLALHEECLEQAATQVVRYGSVMAERAAEFPSRTMWWMHGGEGRSSATLVISPDFFPAIERLEVALRARAGDSLTDAEKLVLYGAATARQVRAGAIPNVLATDVA